jgi:hypothetical protein
VKWLNYKQADSARLALTDVQGLTQRTRVEARDVIYQKDRLLISDTALSRENTNSYTSNSILSEKLGYINCDRYAAQKDAITMNLNGKIEANDLKVVLAGVIFKEINSFLWVPVIDKELQLNMKVPENEKAQLLVIAIQNNEPVWYFEEFTLNTEVNKLVSFTPTSYQEIEQSL